jgi:hypothetical protein
VLNLIGFAMETMIVEIILMRTIFTAVPDLARQIHLDVQTIGVYLPHGKDIFKYFPIFLVRFSFNFRFCASEELIKS